MVGIKLNISSVICHLKNIAQPELRIYFLKNALRTTDEEAKRGKRNEANEIYYNFFTNLIIRSNINTDSKY